MKKLTLLIILAISCVFVLLLAIGIGSVSVAPLQTTNIILKNLFGVAPFGEINNIQNAIIWKLRLPRTLLAFICGSGLAISGVMMQSVLRNPLASSYTLGVSSGAAIGASIPLLFGVAIFGIFTLPIFGLSAGIITVFLALFLAAKIDRNMQNNTIILTGMAFSLFANAALTIIMSFTKENLQKLIFWQMGSFSMKSPQHILLLLPFVVISFLIVMKNSRKMDIMTLGDEQAQTSGVESKKVKILLLSISAIITGAIVSIAGIIGFVDLFTPHAARKLFGASHKWVLPSAALLGGAFMVICDLIARTIVSPIELPVGAITSLLGAPFFIYLYFSRRKKAK